MILGHAILAYTCSYLNPFEFSDLEVERKYFESNPSIGKFYNKLITGTLIKPPQDDPGLIKVSAMHACMCVKVYHTCCHNCPSC